MFFIFIHTARSLINDILIYEKYIKMQEQVFYR